MAKDRELQDHERAHTGKPGSKVDHVGPSSRPRRYIMHTDNPEIIQDSARKYRARVVNPTGKGWNERIDHPSGVTEHRHYQGSRLFTTTAKTPEEAEDKIYTTGVWNK